MDVSAREQYLRTEIHTATPQKLHLLLIEAAIRAVHRGRLHWEHKEDDKACEALVRAQQIVVEILGGFNREVSPQLVEKMSALYLFVFNALQAANNHRDARKLDEALRVLEIEQQTWQEVCIKEGGSQGAERGRDTSIDPPERGLAGPVGRRAVPPLDLRVDSSSGMGFSVDA